MPDHINLVLCLMGAVVGQLVGCNGSVLRSVKEAAAISSMSHPQVAGKVFCIMQELRQEESMNYTYRN